MDYKEAVWLAMIGYGGVVQVGQSEHFPRYCDIDPNAPVEDYYGRGYNYLYEDTLQALDLLQEQPISWSLMTEPRSDITYHFTDTENEPSTANHLWGKLIVAGVEFYWAVDTQDSTFQDQLNSISRMAEVGIKASFEDTSPDSAIQLLAERLDKLKDESAYVQQSRFNRMCELGRKP